MHFLPIHAHGRGRTDAQADPVALNVGHDYTDLLVNQDLFTNAPTQYQHGVRSVIAGNASFRGGLRAR
jgi:hypothetical protein